MADFDKISIDSTTYNVKDTTARNQAATNAANIAIQTSRIDNMASLPSGSTSGDAELIDIRVGADGVTYADAGTAVRTQVDGLKDIADNSIISQSTLQFTPEYYVTDKKGLGTNNTITNATAYSISSPIPLLPGQLIRIIGYGSASSVSMLSPTTEYGTPTSYVVAYPNTETECSATFLNTENVVQYVRCCWLTANSHTITVYNIQLEDISDIKFQSLFYKLDGTVTRVRYAADWTVSNYVCSTPFHLGNGETVHIFGRVATSIPAVIKCDKHGGNRSFVLDGASSSVTHYQYTANEDCYVMIQYHLGDADKEVNKTSNWNNGSIVTDKRHGTVCFIFDDGVTQDADIVNIFESKGLRCGFALISTTTVNNRVNEYLDYQKRGFSILSHSTDAEGMNDSSLNPYVIQQKFINSKSYLNRAGFDIQGWVTPNSQMYESFKPYLELPYNYAYTTYYGSYQEGNRAYNLFSDSPFDLWRLDMFSSTENCMLAIDQCINSFGFLTIYCHAANMQSTHLTRLSDLLDYIKTYISASKIKCLAPNEAFNYYYTVRRSDIITS